MKKGCLIALGIGIVLITVILLLVFGLTRGVVKAGNDFLALLGDGKIAQAYESASPTLKSQQTAAAFERNVRQLGLTDYASATWSTRNVENDRGHLEGTVKTRSGGKIPLNIELIKEAGGWKVYSIAAPQSGVAVEKGGKQMPSDEKLRALTLESLLAFNKAIQEKNFTGFHQQISTLWKQQITPEKLAEIFKPFIEKGADLSPIKKVQPIFDEPPEIDGDGVLILKGYYPTPPHNVRFRLKYVYEHPAWKLLGIRINLE